MVFLSEKETRMKKGFTLLEMLLVIVFIGTAFLSILQLLATSLRSERDIEGSQVAMHLASGRMEELLNSSFASISSEATAEVYEFSSYSRYVSITSLEANLKDLKVRVYWNVGGQSVSYLLETLRHAY